jgi:hypothetical protein
MLALSLRSGTLNLHKFNQWRVTDLVLLRFASALSLFSDDVSNVIARHRINHRRYQFNRTGGVAALCFTNIFCSPVLQFE